MNSVKSDVHYYGVLKLKNDCNDLEIKTAFRHLAIFYNITRWKDENIEEFSPLIAEAYDVLSDPLKRAIYDQYGETGLKRGVSGPTGYTSPYVFHGDSQSTFREFFGTSNPYGDLLSIVNDAEIMESINGRNSCKHNDKSAITPLPLTLTEIFFGALKKIEIGKLDFINKKETDTIFEDKRLDVIVKPGLPTGTRIVFTQEGDRGPNRISADIVFVTEDMPHEIFVRQGDNLVMTVNISLNDALIGTVITVHTLDDRILRVPVMPIITADYQKSVVGEGLPMVTKPNKRGNLIINFKIEFPIHLPMADKYHAKKGFGKTQTDIVDGRLFGKNINDEISKRKIK